MLTFDRDKTWCKPLYQQACMQSQQHSSADKDVKLSLRQTCKSNGGKMSELRSESNSLLLDSQCECELQTHMFSRKKRRYTCLQNLYCGL